MMTILRRGIRVAVGIRLLLDGSCADDYVELLLRLIYAVVILSPPLLDSNAADDDDGVLFAPVGGVLSAAVVVVVALFLHSVYSVEKVMLYYQRHHHLRHRYYCCLYDCKSFLLFDDASFYQSRKQYYALHNLIDMMWILCLIEKLHTPKCEKWENRQNSKPPKMASSNNNKRRRWRPSGRTNK